MGLFSVERKSIGDLLFGVAVVLLFHLSQDRHALYVLPLLILTLSDTAAALVGANFGRHSFQVVSGKKSWEGCLAFFLATALLSCVVLVFMTDLAPLQIVCITLTLAFIGTMVEAVSWHGLDNLFVPLGLFLLLQALLDRTALESGMTLLILSALIRFAYKFNRYSQLNTHALLAGVLATYFFWETGGLAWLIGPLIVFSAHVILACLQNDHSAYGIDSVLSIVSSGILWIFIHQYHLVPYAFYLFILSVAIHLQIIVLLRIRAQRGRPSEYPLVMLVAFLSGWIFLPVLLPQYPATQTNLIIFFSGFIIMAAGGIVFRVRTQDTSLSRWIIQSVYAVAGSLFGLLPVLLLLP
jgi:phytol kinase